jgi:hypothetical protein
MQQIGNTCWPLAALQESAVGPFRRFAAAQQVGSYWGLSGGALLGMSLSQFDPLPAFSID